MSIKSTCELSIMSWNMRSLNLAKHYINDMVNKYDFDILCLSEHRLFQCELYKLGLINAGYKYDGKSSKDLKCRDQNVKRGHCGVAILWKQTLVHRVKVMKINSDRMCGIEILNVINGKSLYIIRVYLPQQGCKISSYVEEIETLTATLSICKLSGEVLIIGDTNAHFGPELGNRFWGRTTPNARLLNKCTQAHDMVIIDAEWSRCKGPKYTFAVENVGSSYVDHCIASRLLSNMNVISEVVTDSILNTSDHLVLLCNITLSEEMQHANVK